METIYTASAESIGGRDGHVTTSDGIIDMDLSTPGRPDAGKATNPEQLFAAGYAACFNSALSHLARAKRIKTGDVRIKVDVNLNKDSENGYELAVKIEAIVPGVTQEVADELAAAAHEFCPYSKATNGNISTIITARVL